MLPYGFAGSGRMHFEGSPEENGGDTKTVSDDVDLAVRRTERVPL